MGQTSTSSTELLFRESLSRVRSRRRRLAHSTILHSLNIQVTLLTVLEIPSAIWVFLSLIRQMVTYRSSFDTTAARLIRQRMTPYSSIRLQESMRLTLPQAETTSLATRTTIIVQRSRLKKCAAL